MRDVIPLLISLLSFAAIAAAVFVAGQFLIGQRQLQRRLSTPARITASSTADDRLSLLQGLVAKYFSDTRFGVDSTLRGKLRHELLRAGYFRTDALNYYLFFRMALPVLLPTFAYVAMLSVADGVPWYAKFVTVSAALAIAIIAPDIYLDRRQRRLAKRYREIFPDFLDLLVVCIDSGLSLEAGLARVTSQVVKQCREFGLHLVMVASEVRAGRRTIDALEALAVRLMIDEAQSLILVLRQSLELGSDVGNTLRVFGAEMREKRVLRAEEHANKLPVKLSVPLVVLIFPVVLIVIMFPVVIRLLTLFAAH